MIVTIDGPAGAGKSSVARSGAAARLRLPRHRRHVPRRRPRRHCAATRPGRRAALAGCSTALRLEIRPGQVLLGGEDVAPCDPLAGESPPPPGPVAEAARAGTRSSNGSGQIAAGRNIVCEGATRGRSSSRSRVQVLPVRRPRRRLAAAAIANFACAARRFPFAEVLAPSRSAQRPRCARDIAPMVPAPDAILLDSTLLTLDEVVERDGREVRLRRQRSKPPWPCSGQAARNGAHARAPSLNDVAACDARLWFIAWYHESSTWPYHAVMTLGFSLRIQGTATCRRTGPALLIANHQSYLDPLAGRPGGARPLGVSGPQDTVPQSLLRPA